MAEMPEPSTEPTMASPMARRDGRVAVVIDAARHAVVAEARGRRRRVRRRTRRQRSVGVLGQVRERGFITTGEIFAAFPDLEPDTDELRDL